MKNQLNQLDAQFESYLARLAGDVAETKVKARQSENVKIHMATPAAGILLPFGQSVLTGGLVGIAAFALAWLFEAPRPWVWGVVGWVIVQCLAWLFLLRDWRTILLQKLESLTGQELDGLTGIGAPAEDDDEPTTTTIRIELTDQGGHHTRYIDLNCNDDQLYKLAEGLASGTTLSESNWTGAGRPFTRAQFAEIRTELLKRGLANWNTPGTPARGCSLTASGRACFKRLYEELSTTPPLEDD